MLKTSNNSKRKENSLKLVAGVQIPDDDQIPSLSILLEVAKTPMCKMHRDQIDSLILEKSIMESFEKTKSDIPKTTGHSTCNYNRQQFHKISYRVKPISQKEEPEPEKYPNKFAVEMMKRIFKDKWEFVSEYI